MWQKKSWIVFGTKIEIITWFFCAILFLDQNSSFVTVCFRCSTHVLCNRAGLSKKISVFENWYFYQISWRVNKYFRINARVFHLLRINQSYRRVSFSPLDTSYWPQYNILPPSSNTICVLLKAFLCCSFIPISVTKRSHLS